MLLCAAVALVFAAGCQPRIGDGCGSYINCDVNGSRICDLSSPGGYCTQRGCDVGTCPQAESLCVQFGTELRLAQNYCMRRCTVDGECRGSQGYHCLTASDVGGVALDVGDGGAPRFCVVAPVCSVDGGTPADDGAVCSPDGG